MDRNFDKMLNALLKYIPDSVYFKDLEGKFVEVSQAKVDNSNTPYPDMIGKTDYNFMPRDEADKAWADDIEVMTSGIPIKDKEEKITRPDGSEVYVSVTKVPWKNEEGETIGIIGISRDITRRVEMEKHNFKMVTSAAHQMRGPLISIGGTLNRVINERYGKIENESVKATLVDLLKRTRGVEGTVSDYLTKSALMVGGKIPDKQELDLRVDIIDPILDEFSQVLIDKKITIDNRLGSIPAGEIKFEAVKSWIKMSVHELLKNAIKYGGGEKEKVIAFGYENCPDCLKIIVYDNGPAIPEEHRETIFEQYRRVEGNTEEKGTGLGLYIIRDTMRMHGGDVYYEATVPENHSTFITIIPKGEENKKTN